MAFQGHLFHKEGTLILDFNGQNVINLAENSVNP